MCCRRLSIGGRSRPLSDEHRQFRRVEEGLVAPLKTGWRLKQSISGSGVRALCPEHFNDWSRTIRGVHLLIGRITFDDLSSFQISAVQTWWLGQSLAHDHISRPVDIPPPLKSPIVCVSFHASESCLKRPSQTANSLFHPTQVDSPSPWMGCQKAWQYRQFPKPSA